MIKVVTGQPTGGMRRMDESERRYYAIEGAYRAYMSVQCGAKTSEEEYQRRIRDYKDALDAAKIGDMEIQILYNVRKKQ